MSLRTPRTRIAKRRREEPSPRRVLITAALATGVVLVLVALSLSIYHGVPWVGYRTIYATVPQTGNLIPHDPVRIAGVRVGQVSGISVDRDGDARIKLQISPHTNLPRGTTFKVRANGLLGSRYVELIPGHGGGELPSGTTLTGTANSLTYGVPDALDVFNQKTRGGLGNMVTGLGVGTLGRGRGLGDTIHEIAAESVNAQNLVHGLIGPGQLSRLVPSLESLMSPLDTAKGDLTAMLEPASQGIEPFVTQRGAVRATLDVAPSALDAAQSGLANGQRLLTAADKLAVQAQAVLPEAPAGLKATTTLLKTSHPALISTRKLLVQAKSTVPAVLRVTRALSPVLHPLSQTLKTADPIIRYVAPYGCNIENFATVIRSMTGYGAADQPGGPNGPAMAFRLQVIPAGLNDMLGIKDNLVKRVGYPTPCSYLSTTYNTSTDPLKDLSNTQGDS